VIGKRGKIVTAVVAGLAVIGLGGAGYVYAVRKGWIRYNEYDRRAEGRLRVGDVAPDLDLTMYDGSPARLSSLWGHGKPLFLVFGSCT
jgi:hypothetical protein